MSTNADMLKKAEQTLNETKLFPMPQVNENHEYFMTKDCLNHTLKYIKSWVPANMEKITSHFTTESLPLQSKIQEIIGKQLILAYDFLIDKNSQGDEDNDHLKWMKEPFVNKMDTGCKNVGSRLLNLMESEWRNKDTNGVHKQNVNGQCCSREFTFGVNNSGHLTSGNEGDSDDIQIPFPIFLDMVRKLYDGLEEDGKKTLDYYNESTRNNPVVKSFISQLSQEGGRKRRRKTKRKRKRKTKRKSKRKTKRKSKRRRKRRR